MLRENESVLKPYSHSLAVIDLLERIKKFKSHAFAIQKCVGDMKDLSGKSSKESSN